MAAFCELSGYKVYAVDIGGALHYIYGREHLTKNEDFPAKKTLFIANIPPMFIEDTLKKVFSVFGSVKEVKMASRSEQNHTNTLAKKLYHPTIDTEDTVFFAHVVFKHEKGLTAALKVDEKRPVINASEFVKGQGLAEWLEECTKMPNREQMEKSVDLVMNAFETSEEKKRQQRAAQKSQPDEDGWTTVTYGRKRAEIDIDPEEEERQNKKKSKKNAVMVNFYRWQQRDAKRD
eukprot:Ihof_evm5s108 gene=Ihof_evmTU5s108